MRDELALALRSDASQHDQRKGERAEKRAQRELNAPVAREVAKQPGTHLPGGQ